MSSIQERLQLKRVPLDTWNIREQLCLASAVVRSGDQNWMSVSRALKTVGEPNRPADWYSQKSCAAQYGALLEHVETPKRKKRSSEGAVETPQESIVKRLTQERIVEIQKTLAGMNIQYVKLKNAIAEARNTATSEERLREIWTNIETAKRLRERETARHAAWLKEREERRARADRQWRPTPTTPTSPAAPAPPSSPLLTSLLKSSPVVTTPQHISHPANVVDTMSPSVTAPTLSMLLEKSSPQHESKHAAIEHIKSQLVQIEHQLKANTAPAPAPIAEPPAPAPAVDLDDIEIKAEDVYVFRDIDIHIPQVGGITKGNNRSNEKSSKVEDENVQIDVVNDTQEETVKEEQITVEEVVEDTHIEVETVEPTPEPVEPTEEEVEVTETEEVKLSFPEVKFPTTEIKVIQPDEQKVKEESKEPEVTSEETPQQVEEEVVVEEEQAPEPVAQEISEPEPVPQTSPPVEEEVPPVVEDTKIPSPETLPPPPEPVVETEPASSTAPPEPPLPPEPEPELPPEPEVKEEQPAPEPETPTVEVTATVTVTDEKSDVDVKKDEDAEVLKMDSIPLKQMVKADSIRPAEPRDERTEDTHTETDDDTPMELSREEEKDGKKKRDYSRKKKPDSRTCSGSESAAEASAPDSPSATDADRQHRLWKKSVMLVYSRLCAHKYASLFLRPISDDEAPGYSMVVRRPMDLTTIRRNIENGVIRTTAEFQRDVLLMFSNALMYNSSEHSVYTMAKELLEEAACQLGMLLAAQAHAGLCAPPPRRKRRRPDDAPHAHKRPLLAHRT